jgi:methylated-DNA-protein-cysteine methyltransferase-like protein
MTNYEPDINHRIWQVVASIPEGKVATYGGVAQKAGIARAARRVGQALRSLPTNTHIPWHRVVNARGRISLPEGSASHHIQRDRLESEGIPFKTNGTIDLNRHGW